MDARAYIKKSRLQRDNLRGLPVTSEADMINVPLSDVDHRA